jgi:hypothetical protein
MSSTHPNSHKITLFRADNFMQRAQNPTENEQIGSYMSMTEIGIGPYFESFQARLIGSGLSRQEEKLLMPYVINVESDEKTFRAQVFDFFNNLKTKVPYGTGKDLEIGLEKSNEEAISADNLPIKIEDFIRYRHAKNHPWVAADKVEAGGNQLKYFYIYDAEQADKLENDRVVVQDKAEAIWLKIKGQPTKINMMLTMLGKDERDFIGRNSEQRKQTALRDIVSKDASKFLKTYQEDRFELRYWLKAMIQAKVVEPVGTSFIIRENKVKLGSSEMEALLYLENKENSDTVDYLKGTTQDVMRKARVTREKPKV